MARNQVQFQMGISWSDGFKCQIAAIQNKNSTTTSGTLRTLALSMSNDN